MVHLDDVKPDDQVRVYLAPEVYRLACVLAIDLVYERQAVVKLLSTGALRTIPVEAIVDHSPAGSSAISASSSMTSAS
jgi:hypothetical protein